MALCLNQKVDFKSFYLDHHHYLHFNSEHCNHHFPYHFHNMCYHAVDGGSDSSDVEIEELPVGSIQAREGRVRNGRLAGRGGGRGEWRPNTGEGTSRGPGELGNDFNPSKYETNRPKPKNK